MEKKRLTRGWFSWRQKDITGSLCYAREDGSEVEVTEVTSDGEKPFMDKDAIDVGLVTDYVRRIKEPEKEIYIIQPLNQILTWETERERVIMNETNKIHAQLWETELVIMKRKKKEKFLMKNPKKGTRKR